LPLAPPLDSTEVDFARSTPAPSIICSNSSTRVGSEELDLGKDCGVWDDKQEVPKEMGHIIPFRLDAPVHKTTPWNVKNKRENRDDFAAKELREATQSRETQADTLDDFFQLVSCSLDKLNGLRLILLSVASGRRTL
jgi:hypothetical protein